MSDPTADAQKLVHDVLSGVVTEATHPHVFDDDVLYFKVRHLEQVNLPWLLQQLADGQFSEEYRLLLALQMVSEKRKPHLKALGAPAFLWQ